MKFKLLLLTLAAVLSLVAGSVRTADAGFQVTISAGGESKTIVDGGGGDILGASNQIGVFQELIGGYLFTFELATTNTPGTNSIAFVNSSIGSIEDISGGPTTVRILASANEFTAPITPPDLEILSGATAQFLADSPTGNTAAVSYAAYIDTSNNLSITGAGTVVGADGPVTITAGAGNTNLSDARLLTSLSPPYAINFELIAQLNQSGSKIDLDGTVQILPTPEPASVAIWAAGLIGIVGLSRLRRRRT